MGRLAVHPDLVRPTQRLHRRLVRPPALGAGPRRRPGPALGGRRARAARSRRRLPLPGRGRRSPDRGRRPGRDHRLHPGLGRPRSGPAPRPARRLRASRHRRGGRLWQRCRRRYRRARRRLANRRGPPAGRLTPVGARPVDSLHARSTPSTLGRLPPRSVDGHCDARATTAPTGVRRLQGRPR